MKGLGNFIIFLGQFFVRRETLAIYVRRIIDESIKVGYNSIFIVVIVSGFIGAVSTIQTAYNLTSPFISKPVIALLIRDMTLLELAPTITAIVYAGKVGSNIAGELGAMRISEQIDALEVMGINSASYLVLPKIIASVIMFPLLVILAGFMSIYGGYLTALLTGVVSGNDYIIGLQMNFTPFSVLFALIKAIVFGFLVASISSYKGFFTHGGALEVGQSSTSAVTSSCIAILIGDYLLAYLLTPLLNQ